jgi:hypothetical protein
MKEFFERLKEFFDRVFDRLSQHPIMQRGGLSGAGMAAVVVGGILFIAFIGWASLRTTHEPTRMPDGIPWICTNGHQFTLTGQELTDHYAKHAADPILCPTCGAPSSRATTCPHCGHVVAPGPDHLCPVCKQPIYH